MIKCDPHKNKAISNKSISRTAFRHHVNSLKGHDRLIAGSLFFVVVVVIVSVTVVLSKPKFHKAMTLQRNSNKYKRNVEIIAYRFYRHLERRVLQF